MTDAGGSVTFFKGLIPLLHKKIDFFLQVFIFVLNFAQNYVTLLDSYNAVNEDNSSLHFFIQPNCIFFRKNVNFLIFSHFSHLFSHKSFFFQGVK